MTTEMKKRKYCVISRLQDLKARTRLSKEVMFLQMFLMMELTVSIQQDPMFVILS